MNRFRMSVAVIGVLTALAPQALRAQQAAPLQKSDLIRLLTGPTYTKAEVAGIIRRSCLTFTPTQRDRADLRSLGADQAVLDAIDECVRRAARLELRVQRRTLSVEAGSSTDLTAIVRRGGAPESGVRLVLVGSGEVPGGPGEDLALRTGADGRATFTVPAGTTAGVYELRVTAPDVSGAGSVTVQLRTSPAAPARAVVSPERLTPDGVGRARVALDLRDAFDNRVAGAEVTLWDGAPPAGREVASGTTNEEGTAVLDVEADLRGVRSLTVYAGETALASIPVAPVPVSASTSGFVEGTGQAADAGNALPAPLVFEVRDAGGNPLPNRIVRFEVANGSADPPEARTDADGRASTTVTLGTVSRPTEVVASVGDVEARTTFRATIGGLTAEELRRRLEEAGRRLDLGDAAGAREAYARLVAANPVSVDALVGHGRALLATGEYTAAASRFREALRIEPSRTPARVGLGTASLRRGDRAEALRWLELATREDPEDAAAWAALAEVHVAAGRTEQARSDYERALALEPGRDEAVRGLARLAPPRPVVEITAWGGNTFDNGRDAGGRTAEVRIYPTPSFSLWGGFDNSL
ncbi:MAG: Ig-like domain-containing protein, partial [Gemmatimonadota bacterium]